MKINNYILVILITIIIGICITSVGASEYELESNIEGEVISPASDEKTFNTISTAISNAEDGSTVYLNSSTYVYSNSRITVSKNIVIDGSTEGVGGLSTLMQIQKMEYSL